MSCLRIQPLLSAFLDCEVSPSERALVRTHLSECENCSAELESLNWTKLMIADLPEVEVPEDLHHRLRQAVLQPNPRKRALRWALGWAMAGAGAAVLCWNVLFDSNERMVADHQATTGTIDRDQAYVAAQNPLDGRFPVISVSNDLK